MAGGETHETEGERGRWSPCRPKNVRKTYGSRTELPNTVNADGKTIAPF